MKVTRVLGLALLILAFMLWLDMAVPYIDSLDAGYFAGLAGQTSLWWTQKLISLIALPVSFLLMKK